MFGWLWEYLASGSYPLLTILDPSLAMLLDGISISIN